MAGIFHGLQIWTYIYPWSVCFYLSQFQIILLKFVWIDPQQNFQNPIVGEFLKLSQVFAVRSNYICKFWHSVAVGLILSHTVWHASKNKSIIGSPLLLRLNARHAWLIDYESFLAVTFPVTEFFSIIIIQNQIWTSSALELKTVSQSSNLMKIQRIEIHRHGIHLITADIWYISSALNKVWRWLNCTDSYSTCEIQRIHCISIPNSKKLRHEC